jgi:predicted ester cyclase
MTRTVLLFCAAAFFALFSFRNAAHAQTALATDEARAVAAPLYDALNQPAKKDLATLLERATNPRQSCGANDQCAPRERVVAGIKSRGETIPDLKWEIKELIVDGNEVIVRGEASGTPVAPLYDVQPTAKGFKIMSIDIHTIDGERSCAPIISRIGPGRCVRWQANSCAEFDRCYPHQLRRAPSQRHARPCPKRTPISPPLAPDRERLFAALPRGERISVSRAAKAQRGIWRRRYWEHTLRDEDDFARHLDYIHYNPVKHGHAARVRDWPFSSLRRWVRWCHPVDWAGDWGACLANGGFASTHPTATRAEQVPTPSAERSNSPA